jgi:hypothetical protein
MSNFQGPRALRDISEVHLEAIWTIAKQIVDKRVQAVGLLSEKASTWWKERIQDYLHREMTSGFAQKGSGPMFAEKINTGAPKFQEALRKIIVQSLLMPFYRDSFQEMGPADAVKGYGGLLLSITHGNPNTLLAKALEQSGLVGDTPHQATLIIDGDGGMRTSQERHQPLTVLPVGLDQVYYDLCQESARASATPTEITPMDWRYPI